LTEAEQQAVLRCLHEDRFQDASPAQVYAALLDEGQFHCSIRTMYRLLEARGESRERRDQLTHPPYQKPELLATQANQLWSWDITKLRGPEKWTCYHLYVILDVFSRFVVGWMIAYRESAELAKRLIGHSCRQTTHRARPVDHPRRSRLIDEIQTGGVAHGRPGRHQNTFPAPCF
jgi:putative transposase